MSRRIRIISLFDDLFFGGDETRLLAFARTVDRGHFDHSVVTIKRADAEANRFYGTMRQQYAAAGVEVIDLDEGYFNAKPTSIRPCQIGRLGVDLFRVVRKLSHLIRKKRI